MTYAGSNLLARATPERELLEQARAGSENAFRDLVDLYTPRVFALVRNLVRNQAEAEDITQEVFFKVYSKLQTFREDAAFYTWLYRVAVNTATDHVKRRRNDRSLQVEDLGRLPVEDPQDSPTEGLSRRDLQSEIRAAMAELPEKFRTIIVLRELEGMSYEDISRVLKCSKGTVESRLFRARARLKDRLDRSLKST